MGVVRRTMDKYILLLQTCIFSKFKERRVTFKSKPLSFSTAKQLQQLHRLFHSKGPGKSGLYTISSSSIVFSVCIEIGSDFFLFSRSIIRIPEDFGFPSRSW